MRICDRCGKGAQVGMNVSHSHIRTKKRSFPNLHLFTMKEAGKKRRLSFCTKCLRIVKKEQSDKLQKSSKVEKEVIALPV
ncbi:MAG: 50S ribosomal protein L28 [Candidatus Woykebacteria bacterium]